MLQFFGVFFLSKDRVWFSLPWTYVRLRTLLYWRECNRSDAMWFPRPVHERDGFHLGPPPLLLFWRKPAAMLWGHSSRPEAFFFFPTKKHHWSTFASPEPSGDRSSDQLLLLVFECDLRSEELQWGWQSQGFCPCEHRHVCARGGSSVSQCVSLEKEALTTAQAAGGERGAHCACIKWKSHVVTVSVGVPNLFCYHMT